MTQSVHAVFVLAAPTPLRVWRSYCRLAHHAVQRCRAAAYGPQAHLEHVGLGALGEAQLVHMHVRPVRHQAHLRSPAQACGQHAQQDYLPYPNPNPTLAHIAPSRVALTSKLDAPPPSRRADQLVMHTCAPALLVRAAVGSIDLDHGTSLRSQL